VSSAGVFKPLEEAVGDLLPAGLALGGGVVALGLEGGSEFDGGDEEGAGLADRDHPHIKPFFGAELDRPPQRS